MTTRKHMKFSVITLLLISFILIGAIGAGMAAAADSKTTSTPTKAADDSAKAAASKSSYCLSCQKTGTASAGTTQTVNYYNFAQGGGMAVGNTGFVPMDTAVTMISRFFMINVLRTNVAVQLGFIRFILFIVLFTLFRFGLGKIFDSNDANQAKNINIIGFAIALIGAIFMKDQWVLANGGVMAAVAGLLVPLLIAIPALVYSFKKENNEGYRNWIGVGILFAAFMIITLYMNITGFATAGAFLLVPIGKSKLHDFFHSNDNAKKGER